MFIDKPAEPPKSEKIELTRQMKYIHRMRFEKNNIDNLPAVKRPAIRKKMVDSLEFFLKRGFPHIFSSDFGTVQKSSIAFEESILKNGGRNINKLEPRGFGKSVRSILGMIWASLTGRQRFSLLCCDSKEKADDLLQLAHKELGSNDFLQECFPEIYPFSFLEGNPHRCKYQTHKGEKTGISIKNDTIKFPILPGYKSSGAIIAARPFRKARGKNISGQRPTVIIMDDIQATEDADSPTAIRKNLKTLRSDIAFLGDRANPISIINNATIIQAGDFPDTLTSDPGFKTIRYKMVEKWPKSDLWKKYEEIRQAFSEVQDDDLRARRDALKFYKSNRDEMDAGSVVTWDYAYSRKDFDCEISTIQAAYNFIIDFGKSAFQSECQNDPEKPTFDSDDLTKTAIQNKQHGQHRGIIPQEMEFIVCDIDVQGEVLFFTEAAGNSKFDAAITNYGTFPDQKKRFFKKSALNHTFSKRYKGADEDSKIYQAVREFLEIQVAKTFKRNGDGAKMQFSAIAIDVKWNEKLIKRAIRDVGDPRVIGYNGHGITAVKAPMAAWKTNAGDKKGVHWFLRSSKSGIRNFVVDVNFWKSFLKKRFLIPLGQETSLTLFKTEPENHSLFASHIKAERGKVQIDEASGRRVEVWDAIPGEDNDFLDTATGAMALLSFAGAGCLGAEPDQKKQKKRKQVTYF